MAALRFDQAQHRDRECNIGNAGITRKCVVRLSLHCHLEAPALIERFDFVVTCHDHSLRRSPDGDHHI
jgi:hypothetical protein